MADPFIGLIMPISFDFAPMGWAFCDGTSLVIRQFPALYSIIGSKFGGDSRIYFSLPDLRTRIPIGSGQGAGLTERSVGGVGGTESVTLTEQQVMAHTHQAVANNAANQVNPTGMIWGGDTTGTNPYYADTAQAHPHPLSEMAIGSAGGLHNSTEPHNNLPPALGMYYVIAIEGWYPVRNW